MVGRAPFAILQVYNRHRFGGGSDVAADNTVRLLSQSGCRVTTFTRDSRKLSPGVRGRLAAFLSGLYAPETVHAFRRELAARRPDVVHVHELYPMISPWILPVCRADRIPAVMTCHDYRLTCPVATHYRRSRLCLLCRGGRSWPCALHNCRGNRQESAAYALRAAVARSFRLFRDNVTLFITPSEFVRRWLADSGWPADRIVAVPNIVPNVSPGARASDRGEYVAFAGRSAPEKGLETLLAAARAARLPLRLAGSFASLPRRASAESGVRFVGELKPEEMSAFYRGARMVVVPSEWQEPFGLVAGEALRCGVPVIAARIGALPELVENGVTGLLFAAGDAVELAARLRYLWNHPQLGRKMGEAGRARVKAHCAPEVHLAQLMAVYQRARELMLPRDA